MSTTITRHPEADTLMSFAAGSLPEPLSAAMAAHAAMCGDCCRELRDMELIGAALLAEAAATPGALDDKVAVPPAPPPPVAPPPGQPSPAARTATGLPEPLASKCCLTLDSIPWTRMLPGVWHHRLPLSPGVRGDLRLVRIAAGRKLPTHGHGASELTLVLDGAFSDEIGEYRRGDIQDIDYRREHQPVADRKLGCICLIACDRPLRFKGWFGLLLRFFGPRRKRRAQGRAQPAPS
jgi:putative transcriptional regulator